MFSCSTKLISSGVLRDSQRLLVKRQQLAKFALSPPSPYYASKLLLSSFQPHNINNTTNNHRSPLQLNTTTTTKHNTNFIQKMNLMTISQSLDESYTKHKIVPDVVDKFDTQGLLTIEYGGKDHVALGNTLKVDETQERPTIQFTLNSPGSEKELEISANDKFGIVLTDPDAPSNKDHKWSEYAHWIITDLQLNTSSEESDVKSLSTVLDYSTGNEILPYEGPAPPPGTGKHRYVFLLFKQDPSINYKAPEDRPTWGTNIPGSGYKDWIQKYGGKSQLLALNFFYAQDPKQD